MSKTPRGTGAGAGAALSLPKWLATYEHFIAKNAGQVSQIESALRSLTYIIPGLFLPSPPPLLPVPSPANPRRPLP